MNYKFGRRPVVSDERTIRLSSILKPLLLPALPSNFDNDVALNGIDDEFVYNNSKYGDCVIASRAHHTLRFEKFEQGTQIFISDEEVVNEYFDQSGGLDRGLVLLFSLNDWKNDGWDIGIRHYEVYAYAKVDVDNHNEAKHAIHLLNGLNIGVQIYDKDLTQMDNGEVWDITDDDGSLRGGHGIYIYAYDEEGLWCMTWGKRQKMTWKWWDYRVDEAYAIMSGCMSILH